MMIMIPFCVHLFNKTSWKFSWLIIIVVFFANAMCENMFMRILSISCQFMMGLLTHRYLHVINRMTQSKFSKFFCWGLALLLLDIRHIGLISYEIESGYLNMIGIIQAIGASILIGLLFLTSKQKVLSNRIVVRLGNNSYEFYIFHMVALLVFVPILPTPFCSITISLCLSIMIASILNKLTQILVLK